MLIEPMLMCSKNDSRKSVVSVPLKRRRATIKRTVIMKDYFNGLDYSLARMQPIIMPALCISKDSLNILINIIDLIRNALQVFRAELIQQLEATEDPALALHLAVDLVFLSLHQVPIHISGRFIPQVLSLVSEGLDEAVRKVLLDCQS